MPLYEKCHKKCSYLCLTCNVRIYSLVFSMFFEKADNSLSSLGLKNDVSETLIYEYCYKSLIERVELYNQEDRISFVMGWYHELIASIRDCSLTQDRKFFESLDPAYKKSLYAKVLLYRYDHQISIMDDLSFEQTSDYIKECQNNLEITKMTHEEILAIR